MNCIVRRHVCETMIFTLAWKAVNWKSLCSATELSPTDGVTEPWAFQNESASWPMRKKRSGNRAVHAMTIPMIITRTIGMMSMWIPVANFWDSSSRRSFYGRLRASKPNFMSGWISFRKQVPIGYLSYASEPSYNSTARHRQLRARTRWNAGSLSTRLNLGSQSSQGRRRTWDRQQLVVHPRINIGA